MAGKQVKSNNKEPLIFLLVFLTFFGLLGYEMGLTNMLNTMMNTAYSLLIDTAFYIMAISVLAGAIGSLFMEFGVINVMNKMLSPLMKPLFGLPGASALGVLTTFLSDNPAILSLADDHSFKKYFKKYQLPALTNLGTGFGMGLIIVSCMIGIKPIDGSESFVLAGLVGLIGASIGSIVSVRIMLLFTKKIFGVKEEACEDHEISHDENIREIREGGIGARVMNALIEGGHQGVKLGLQIIPGILIICTLVMMLTNSCDVYTGGAYEGVGLLPFLANKISFILTPLFGFKSPECIAVPITALGAAGAAVGLVPNLVSTGMAVGNDIAVFSAMCMCFSGYLSTHVAMMSVLGFPQLSGKSIIAHTIGGIVSGISAHLIYMLVIMI